MKTLVIILIISSFFQTTVIPVDLVLLILMCRAYLKSGKENLYLAFAFGLLIAHLNLTSLGLTAFIYLIIIQITQIISKRSFSNYPLVLMPVSFILLSFSQIVNLLLTHQTINFLQIVISALLSFPIYYLVKLWEDRFIARKEIKLKI